MTARNRFGIGNGKDSARSGRVKAARRALLAAAFFAFLAHEPPARSEHFYTEQFGRTNVGAAAFYSRVLHRNIQYSVYLPPSYFEEPTRRFPVIYYLHGFDARGVAYQDWPNWHLDEALDSLIARNQVQEMVVAMPECFSTGIVVNWGRYPRLRLPSPLTFPFRLLRGALRSLEDPTYFGTYLFIHRWDLSRTDYADFFTTEFLPHIEDTYRTKGEKKFRAISGFSTGGYSALSIAFQNPHLFDSVSAHAPMLVSGSPFSAEAKELFVEFDPAENEFVPQRFTIQLLRRIFADENTWRANDPIALARKGIPEGLSVYLDVAERDKRKYDLGARALVEVLTEGGTPVQFELVPGLSPATSHTYPGFINGKLIAEHAEGKSEEELRERYGWKKVRTLLSPEVQQIEHSLRFHSREFFAE